MSLDRIWSCSWSRRVMMLSCLIAPGLLPVQVSGQIVEGQNTKSADQAKPPWQRRLTAEIARKVGVLDRQIADLEEKGQFAETTAPLREVLELRRKLQGEDHWETTNMRLKERTRLRAVSLSREAQLSLGLAARNCDEADELHHRGRYAEAEELYRKVLTIRRDILGEDYPETAIGYNGLGSSLMNQAKYPEAEPQFQRAVSIKQNLFGENHPSTALGYNQLAMVFEYQGRYADAEKMFRRSLATRLRVLGESDPQTAGSYNSFAAHLNNLGRHAEAEPFLRRALATKLRVLGENHESTAASYNNLSYCLEQQGKYNDAEYFHQKTLAICRQVLGENHPKTTLSYLNLGWNLHRQGKYNDADAEISKAIAAFGQQKGGEKPDKAYAYNTLAANRLAQGKYSEVEPLLRNSLDISLRLLGENNLYSARSHGILAASYDIQGKYLDAERIHRKALAMLDRLFGPDHPETAIGRRALAVNLNTQGKYADAETIVVAAARSFETARLQMSSIGLDRVFFAESSPLPILAVLKARQGQDDEAWKQWEGSLARGLFDDLSVRRSRPLSADSVIRQDEVVGRLNRLNNQIAALAGAKAISADRRGQLQKLEDQRLELQSQLTELESELVKNYGVAAGARYGLNEIQARIPESAALVGWLDLKTWPRAADPRGDHWVCVVRSTGVPMWSRIAGSGSNQAWTQEDSQRPGLVRRNLRENTSAAGEKPLAELSAQLLGPVEDTLQARRDLPPVKHLIVLPSPVLAGIPIEALLEVRPQGSPRFVVSYAPSGTMFAWLQEQREKRKVEADQPRTLLALGDPIPPRSGAPTAPPPTRPDPIVLREADAVLRAMRGTSFPRLPGSAREVNAIARLFDQKQVFLGSAASEQTLDSLRAKETLSKFAVIHLATHGRMDDLVPMNSRLLFSQDQLPEPSVSISPDQPFYDGTLTAGEVMSTWKLSAELVTLSACQSGLGRNSGGEGIVGFAQAFFLAGARSLVVSLWEVDDRATSLLMTRFYEKWLENKSREKRMTKAEALCEAKAWLRGLTSDQVDSELERISRGEPRPKKGKPVTGHPFEHPHYWAAFILMGDPS
jgi:CHAT domain-containing protein